MPGTSERASERGRRRQAPRREVQGAGGAIPLVWLPSAKVGRKGETPRAASGGGSRRRRLRSEAFSPEGGLGVGAVSLRFRSPEKLRATWALGSYCGSSCWGGLLSFSFLCALRPGRLPQGVGDALSVVGGGESPPGQAASLNGLERMRPLPPPPPPPPPPLSLPSRSPPRGFGGWVEQMPRRTRLPSRGGGGERLATLAVG